MKLLLILSLFLYTSNSVFAKKENVFQAGEILEYDVSFWGISLGTIVVESIGEEELDGKKVFKAISNMKTHRGVPFITLNEKFISYMNKSLSYSHKFISNSKLDDDKWGFQQIDFNYDDGKIRFQDWVDKDRLLDTIIYSDKKYNDGTSLFFIARKYIDYGKTIKIPTMINKNNSTTIINFKNKIENVKVSSIDYNVETIYFDGQALWEGIYGLNGKFEGWFSNDEASIPILAKMNVYVGSVVIELKSWTRKDWVPPKAK